MFSPIFLIQSILLGMGLFFTTLLLRVWRSIPSKRMPNTEEYATGFFVNFLDTLGIGNFAVTTAIARWRKMLDDDLLPGTLNVGTALISILQALIYIKLIEVDMWLLISCVVAAVIGTLIAVRIIVKLPIKNIRLIMGTALLIFGLLFAARGLNLFPEGGAANALSGWRFWVAVGGFFILGGLLTAGIGLYAPAMILLALLGLDLKAVFPIMMATGAFVQSTNSSSFLKAGKIAPGLTLGLTLAGIPAVLLAVFVVKEIPLEILRWIVIAAVFYTSYGMFRSALQPKYLAQEKL
jgi:uncharacterized membrane protein YfcA